MTATVNVAIVECCGCDAIAAVPPAGFPAPPGWLRHHLVATDEMLAWCPSCSRATRSIVEATDPRGGR